MENVPEVVGSANIKDFQKWEAKLRSLGYVNHIQILNAKHYGIPQNRKRCFMVSILNANFEFGGKMPLKYELKDLLEDEVDEKYYLSDKMIKGMINTKFNSCKLENRKQNLEGCVDTLTTSTGNRCPHLIVKNATKLGYLEAEEGDGVDISGRMEYHRGTVQKGVSQTLLTGGVNVGVVVKDEKNNYYGVYDLKESNTFRPTIEKRIHKDYPYSKTLTCRDDSCCIITRGGTII